MNICSKISLSKIIVDITMLIGCTISPAVFEKSKKSLKYGEEIEDIFHWGTLHCIISIAFICIILIHMCNTGVFTEHCLPKNFSEK